MADLHPLLLNGKIDHVGNIQAQHRTKRLYPRKLKMLSPRHEEKNGNEKHPKLHKGLESAEPPLGTGTASYPLRCTFKRT
jgi:hypothetical protein